MKNTRGKQVCVVIGATSKWQSDGRNTILAHGHPIDDGNIAELLVIGAAFVVGERIAVKPGGDEILLGRVWKKVAGNLFQRELVEGFVPVQGPDDVIPVRPDGPRRIIGITRGIGIARLVEP